MEELEGEFGKCQNGVCCLHSQNSGPGKRRMGDRRQKTEEEEVIEDLREFLGQLKKKQPPSASLCKRDAVNQLWG